MFTGSLVLFCSLKCVENGVILEHALATSVVEEEAQVPRELVNHPPNNYATLHLLSFGFLG
jgi:hypothetical protein